MECTACRKHYNGSTVTKFCARVNYKSTHLNFWKEQKVSNQAGNQKSYLQNDHSRICDWEIKIIVHAEMEKSLWQKYFYWCQKLMTYFPFGLNEHAVYQTS